MYTKARGGASLGLGGGAEAPPPIKLSRAKNNDTLCTVQCTQYCTRTCTVHCVQYMCWVYWSLLDVFSKSYVSFSLPFWYKPIKTCTTYVVYVIIRDGGKWWSKFSKMLIFLWKMLKNGERKLYFCKIIIIKIKISL